MLGAGGGGGRWRQSGGTRVNLAANRNGRRRGGAGELELLLLLLLLLLELRELLELLGGLVRLDLVLEYTTAVPLRGTTDVLNLVQ